MTKPQAYALDRTAAVHALADGRLIVGMPHGMNPIRFGDDGFEQWVPTIGWAPMSHAIFNRYKSTFYLFVEQNPYARGSFEWAEFEFRRGASVRRACRPDVLYEPDGLKGQHSTFENFLLRPDDFRAHDWEVVPDARTP